MERARGFVVAALLVACNATQQPVPKDIGVIVNRDVFTDHWSWQASPWFRPSAQELDYPVFILIDIQGRACIVNAADWVTVMDNEHYDCRNGWLRSRPRASTI